MLFQSSFAMRETGEMGMASPAVCDSDNGPPTPKLPVGVWLAESTLGGDCRAGFSVLRSAAGTYMGVLSGRMGGAW